MEANSNETESKYKRICSVRKREERARACVIARVKEKERVLVCVREIVCVRRRETEKRVCVGGWVEVCESLHACVRERECVCKCECMRVDQPKSAYTREREFYFQGGRR